ncbi:hypothetical protein CXY97_14560 [Staphylococcus aureus]|nr:polymorphic toxin type 50 domain-containing protein [Staphylococcus aureus]PKQ98203.1 hypothetical protein CXY97_14560 [Staphylococcus aureus]
MLGHHLYNENKKRAILNNKKLPSYTILSIDLLNELLREKMSTGNLILSDERFDLKEIINFNQIIGEIHIENVYIETRKGKVHYSKTGAHIVPYIDK